MKKIIFLFVFFVQMIDATFINYSVSATIGWDSALELFESGFLSPNKISGSIYIRDIEEPNNVEIVDKADPIFFVDLLRAISQWKPGALIKGFDVYRTKGKIDYPITVSMYGQPIPVETVVKEIVKRGGVGTPFSKEILNRFPKRNGRNSPVTNELYQQYRNIQEELVMECRKLSPNPQFFKQLALLFNRNNILFEFIPIIVTYHTNINPEYVHRYPLSDGRIQEFFSDRLITLYSNPDQWLNLLTRSGLDKTKIRYESKREDINNLLNTPEDEDLILHARQKTQTPQFRQIAMGALFLTPVIAASLSKS